MEVEIDGNRHIFCLALVSVPVFPDVFPAPLRGTPAVSAFAIHGEVLLHTHVYHAGLVYLKRPGVCHHAPYAS